jgi:cytoskeletal protein CcmA (bactofilin family)
MFGNNVKKEVQKNSATRTPIQGVNTINSIAFGTRLEGTINADNDIRIDGVIKGNLMCKGKVIIGPKGKVDGEIKCKNAVIEGVFNGKLKVSDLLNVRESARIEGDIDTNQLIVQSGAMFNVSCNMGGQKIKEMGSKETSNGAKKITASIG